MDFGELLHTAKKNDNAKPQVQYYSTKFSAPKKEHRAKTVSVNVQKFLARKEAEEKIIRGEAIDKRNKLLALRSQDKKATRRVSVMLKRTKSANQSVIADALDADNTAVTLVGPSQPDEDDYGYVSQESSALYNKMMEKYSKMPDEPKFPEMKKKISTNLTGTKDRVRAALEKEKEEALLPHRRKRKLADGGDDPERSMDKNMELDVEPERKEIAKPKFKPAPLVNFSDLLKLAEKKQFEPVVIEPKKEDKERPLTKKQKKEMEREKEWRERKESRNNTPQEKPQTLNRIPKLNSSASQSTEKNPKKVSIESQDLRKIKTTENTSDYQNTKTLDRNSNIAKVGKTPNKTSTSPINMDRKHSPRPLNNSETSRKSDPQQRPVNGFKSSVNKPFDKSRQESKAAGQMPPPPTPIQKSKPYASNDKIKMDSSRDLQRKTSITESKKQLPQYNAVNTKNLPSNTLKSKQCPPNNLKSKQFSPSDLKPKQFPPSDLKPKPSTSDHKSKQSLPSNLKPKQFPPTDLKTKQFPPIDLKPKQFPPTDLKPKQFPPTDLKPKQFPPTDLKPKQFPPTDLKPKQFPPTDVKPKQFPPTDLKPKQFPPSDLKSKQFPPSDLKSKQFPPRDVRRNPKDAKRRLMLSKRRILDDDYDPDMDDFIDDGPEEQQDYSKYISEIFGYDKRRYAFEDEDVDNMETSFAQQMKEEVISTKIGIMEDLEDMRQEEEAKKRKLVKKRGKL